MKIKEEKKKKKRKEKKKKPKRDIKTKNFRISFNFFFIRSHTSDVIHSPNISENKLNK